MNLFGTKLKKNVWFIVMAAIAAALIIFNIIYGIIFIIAYTNIDAGASVFASELHLNLLITTIVLNAVYLITLAVMVIIRKVKS